MLETCCNFGGVVAQNNESQLHIIFFLGFAIYHRHIGQGAKGGGLGGQATVNSFFTATRDYNWVHT